MVAQPTPPPRISASASPIPADAVSTIRMTLSVALLTAPNGQATMRLEGPKGMIDQGAFFAVRYYVHGRARRALVQAQRVTQASVNRDLVTVKIISDAMVQQRDARRELVNLGARARFLSGSEDDARIVFEIELADVSLSGVGLDSHVELSKGDRLEVQIGTVCAEVEIVRCDPLASVPFGARFVRAEEGAALFAIALDAIWSAPRRSPSTVAGELAVPEPGDEQDPGGSSGMHARRSRG